MKDITKMEAFFILTEFLLAPGVNEHIHFCNVKVYYHIYCKLCLYGTGKCHFLSCRGHCTFNVCHYRLCFMLWILFTVQFSTLQLYYIRKFMNTETFCNSASCQGNREDTLTLSALFCLIAVWWDCSMKLMNIWTGTNALCLENIVLHVISYTRHSSHLI